MDGRIIQDHEGRLASRPVAQPLPEGGLIPAIGQRMAGVLEAIA